LQSNNNGIFQRGGVWGGTPQLEFRINQQELRSRLRSNTGIWTFDCATIKTFLVFVFGIYWLGIAYINK